MLFEELRKKYKTPYERESLSEGLNDPPPVLVLRRTGVRDFPTGERVALYYNSKLKLTFSVPYGSKKGVVSVGEERNLFENRVIQQLQKIVQKNEIRDVKFKNGGRTRVNVTTATNLLNLHDQMTPGNKDKLTKLINANPESLAKASAFAFKNLQ